MLYTGKTKTVLRWAVYSSALLLLAWMRNRFIAELCPLGKWYTNDNSGRCVHGAAKVHQLGQAADTVLTFFGSVVDP